MTQLIRGKVFEIVLFKTLKVHLLGPKRISEFEVGLGTEKEQRWVVVAVIQAFLDEIFCHFCLPVHQQPETLFL